MPEGSKKKIEEWNKKLKEISDWALSQHGGVSTREYIQKILNNNPPMILHKGKMVKGPFCVDPTRVMQAMKLIKEKQEIIKDDG